MNNLLEYESNSSTEEDNEQTVESGSDFFSLKRKHSESDDCDADSPHDVAVIKSKAQLMVGRYVDQHKLSDISRTPKTGFWNGIDDDDFTDRSVWDEPQRKHQEREDVIVSKAETVHRHYRPKFCASRLEKSCFYVHSKVAPLINVTPRNRHASRLVAEHVCHKSCINRIQWCVPQYSHLLLSCSMDGYVKVWNAFNKESTMPLQQHNHHVKGVKAAVWTSNGRQIISGGYNCTANLFDVESGKLVSSFLHKSHVTAVERHPVEHNLFVSGALNIMHCWDIRRPSKSIVTYKYKDKFGQTQDLAFTNNGKELFSCNDLVSKDSSDRNIMAWDFASGVAISNQIYQERYSCVRLSVRPHSSEFIAQSQGGYIAIFSTIRPYKMNLQKRYSGHKVTGYSVGCCYSPDGNLVATGSLEGDVIFFNAHSTRIAKKLHLGNSVVMDVAFHPLLNSTIAASTADGDIFICE